MKGRSYTKSRLGRLITALLLSVMMTVTFVPTSIFAGTAEQNDDGTQVEQNVDLQNGDGQEQGEVVEEPAADQGDVVKEAADRGTGETPETKGDVNAKDGDDEPEPEDEDVTVTLTVRETELKINESVKYRAKASVGVDVLTVYFDSEHNDEDGDNYERTERSTDEVKSSEYPFSYAKNGTYTIKAVAYVYDEDEEDYVPIAESDEIKVQVTRDGTVGDFSITKVNNKTSAFDLTITRGEGVTIECESADNATHYWADVKKSTDDEDEPWEWFGHFADTNNTTITLDTIRFEEGQYQIKVGANAPGYGDNYSDSFVLTVEDLSLGTDEMFFEVSKNTLLTNEDFTLSAYCPDADQIEICFDSINNPGWSEYEGNPFSRTYSYDRAGTYKLVATAYHYNDNTEQYEVITSKEATVNVTAPNGPLNIVMPELPQYIDVGENLSFEVEKPESAKKLKVSVGYNFEDEVDNHTLFEDETDEDSVDVDLNTENLEEGAGICIQIEAWGVGYEYARVEKCVPIKGDASDAVIISADEPDIVIRENARVVVETADEQTKIEEVQFFSGENLTSVIDVGYTLCSYDFYYDKAGSYTVFARVLLEGSEEWVTTEAVVINVVSYGQVGDFSITKVNNETENFDLEVTRGDIITIECSESENAEYYWIDAKKEYESQGWTDYDSFGDTKDGSFTFNTIELAPGRYQISVMAGGHGYEGNESSNSFILTVKDMNLEPGKMFFEVSENALLTNEKLTFSAYYPGADYIKVYKDYVNDKDYDASRWRDSIGDTVSYDEAGTYQLVAAAYSYDPDTEQYTLLKTSDPIEVVVSAPNGPLNITMPELPGSITAGKEDLAFTVTKPTGAAELSVEIWYETDDYSTRLCYEETEGESIDINLDKSRFDDMGVIEIGIDAWGFGYENAYETVRIPVILEASENVIISADKTNVFVNDDVRITVEAANGAPAIDEVRLYDGVDFWDEEEPDENGKFSRTISFDEPGQYSVLALVKFKNNTKWVATESIAITAKSYGRVGEFSIIKVNNKTEDFDLEVTRGDIVTIVVGESEHADHYWINADKKYGVGDDEDWDSYGRFADSDDTTISLDTIELEPGEYIIEAGADGVGYDNRSSKNSFHLTVKDMEIEPDDVYFAVSKNSLLTNEDFTFSAYCPSADEIEVYLDSVNDPEWTRNNDENYISGSHFYWETGTYKLVAVASAYNEDTGKYEEIARSEEIAVTVTAPNGLLNIAMPDLPDTITAGEDNLTFTVDRPENALGVGVDVWYEFDDEDNHSLFWEQTKGDSLEVIIDTKDLNVGATLCVRIEAWGRGYALTEEIVRIPVIGEISDAVSIAASKTTALVGEDIEVTIDAGEAEIDSVQFFGGYDLWEPEGPDEDNSSVYTAFVSFDRAGSYNVYALVKLKDSGDESGDDEEWLQTRLIGIDVDANGQTGEFHVTKVKGIESLEATVAQGTIVTIEYTTAEHANRYWADVEVYDEDEDKWKGVGHYADTNGQIINLGTAEFEPGQYRVWIKAIGLGYETSEADYPVELTVTESEVDEDEILLEVSPTELLTNEDFTFSAYCPNADRIVIYPDYEGQDSDWFWDNEGGNSFAGTGSYDDTGSFTLAAIAYDDQNEIIDLDTQVMKVTAPNGDLPITMPNLPGEICAGGDGLSFNVAMPNGASGMRTMVYYMVGGERDYLFHHITNQGSEAVNISADELIADETLHVRIVAWGIGYNTVAEEREIDVVDHNLTAHPAVEATCIATGNSAYWSCDRCGKFFSDADGTNEIAENSWTTEKLNHNMTVYLPHAATCTEPGNTAYWYCSGCEKYYSDKDGENEIAENSWVIPAGHHMTAHPAVEATCEAAGNTAYWYCDQCEKYFSDEVGENEIAENIWVIDKLAHHMTAQPATAATCTAAGNSAYWYCDQCEKYYSDEEGTAEIAKNSWVIPASHTLKEHVNNPAGYLSNGSEYDICSVCGEHYNIVNHPGWANNFVKKLKVAKGKKAITVKWKKQSKKNRKRFNGYEIQVATDQNFTNIIRTATAGKKAKSKKFKGLQKKTVYYVRVRSFTQVGGDRYYSDWSNKTGKTK